ERIAGVYRGSRAACARLAPVQALQPVPVLVADFALLQVGGLRAVVDFVLHRVKGAGQLHRHGGGGADDGSLDHVVDGRSADVDVTAAADAQQRRLDVEVLVVRDAVLDREARGKLREVGPFPAVSRLPRLLAGRG